MRYQRECDELGLKKGGNREVDVHAKQRTFLSQRLSESHLAPLVRVSHNPLDRYYAHQRRLRDRVMFAERGVSLTSEMSNKTFPEFPREGKGEGVEDGKF